MARRGENIYKRKDGRWEGRYPCGRSQDGKIIFRSVYGRSYGDVKTKLLPLKLENANRDGGKRYQGLFREYALDWLRQARQRIKPSTYSSYHIIAYSHILPTLGAKPLKRLSTDDINGLIDLLKAKGLSAGTIRNIYRVLSAILSKAVETGALEKDICQQVTLPTATLTSKVPVLSFREQYALEKAARSDENGIPVVLALYTGMRLGEICALCWEDIDLERNIIWVSHTAQRISLFDGEQKTAVHVGTPKSRASQRGIPLPLSLAKTLRSLKPQEASGFVITNGGKMVEPRVLQYRFRNMLKKAELRLVNFHALRHTFATRCIERNMDVTTLSQILGHASVKLTLDTYTDSIWEHKAAAIRLLDNMTPVFDADMGFGTASVN